MLKTLSLDGVIITGDAIFTQKEICRVIIEGGGEYFFAVKDNQLTLEADIAWPSPRSRPLLNGRRHPTSDTPKRSRKAMAGSRPAAWRRPPA